MLNSTIPNLDIDKVMRLTRGSFAVDGMIVSKEEEDITRRYLNGEITTEEAFAQADELLRLRKVQTA